MAKRALPIEEKVKELEAAGYVVKRKVTYVNHTFQADAALLKEFFKIQVARDMRVFEAFNEAIGEWVERYCAPTQEKK